MNKRIIKSNEGGAELTTSFNTVVYAGNSTTNRQITGVGFQPDFVWIKGDRNSDHALFDSVRGSGSLVSNGTNVENNSIVTNSSYDIDGFTIGNDNGTQNQTGYDYVAWCWKAGDSTEENTDGTITSQVSANPGAGFSVVSWSGLGTSDSDTNGGNFWRIGHGLNDAPKMIIVKCRTFAHAWYVGHDDLSGWTSGYHLVLNSSAAEAAPNPIYGPVQKMWGNAVPSDTTFGVGGWDTVNRVGDDYIAYCFAEVEGFSKFGSYLATNAAGNFQDCGFEPAFVMIKQASGGGGGAWWIFDNKRTPSNPRNLQLRANVSLGDYTLNGIDFLPTGFEFNNSNFNDESATYIYMAFANQF